MAVLDARTGCHLLLLQGADFRPGWTERMEMDAFRVAWTAGSSLHVAGCVLDYSMNLHRPSQEVQFSVCRFE